MLAEGRGLSSGQTPRRSEGQEIGQPRCDVNEGLKERFFGATEEDEGRPLGVGRQRQASNQAVRLELKRPRS